MNTIIDLNIADNISYNNEASYAIVFGANAGNTTANVNGYATANITQRTTLTSITSPVRDLLLDVQFSNVGVVDMNYAGTYSNIGLLQIAPAAWRVSGIRSVAQYTEAMANVKFTDLSGGFSSNPDYSYVTTVNDQSGNTRTWTTTLNVIAQPTLSVTGNVIYNEDTLTNVTVANVLVDPGTALTFRLFANTIPTYGTMTDGVVTGNSIFIDGNATSLNSQITAGGLKFLPASDFASNVGNAINFSLGNTTTVFSTANANIQIGTAHAEYNFPDGTYTEDTRLAFGNTISDLDTHALSFTIGIQQTAGNIGQFYQSNSLVGFANTRLNATGSRTAINNTIEWMPPIDYTGNVAFTYNQIKTLATGNVTQASNVVATFTAVTNPEISNMGNRTYTTNTITQLFSTSTPVLNDGPDYGQSYTFTLNSPVGKFGNSVAYFSSNTFANLANTYTFTGNTSTVNADFSNIRFAPTNRVSGNSTFTYTQSRDGNSQVSLTPTLTANVQAFGSNTYTYTANTTFTPTFNDIQYGLANILLVGGGGYGQYGNSALPNPGGGTTNTSGGAGGGGEVRYVGNISLTNTTYTVVVAPAGNLYTPIFTANSSVTGGNISLLARAGVVGSYVISPSGSGFQLDNDNGGRGGGNIATGNITGGAGGTSGVAAASGVVSGTSNDGSAGGGGGAEGYPNISANQGGNGAPGVTHPLTGNLVLGGGGATRAQVPGANGIPGGNSYGLGGSTFVPGSTDGAAGVVIISIT